MKVIFLLILENEKFLNVKSKGILFSLESSLEPSMYDI